MLHYRGAMHAMSMLSRLACIVYMVCTMMTDAAKKHDAGYAAFAARMIAALATEEASIGGFTRHASANADNNAATIAPKKA